MKVKLSEIKDIVVEAGKIIEKYFYQDIEINYKLDKTPVTIADFETNEFLKKHLHELFPEAGWLSEEDKDNSDRLSQEYLWIVDPLDGTKDFSEKRPEVAISVGLVKNNQPVLGAVYNPLTKEGGVSSIWEEPVFWDFTINKNSANDLNNSSIVVSRTEFDKNKFDFFEGISVRPLGSVANKLMRVAGGLDDFYFSISPKCEWDVAGGVALLNATGKIYQRFDKQPVLFNQSDTKLRSGTLAGDKVLMEEFLDRFHEQLKNYK